MGFKTNLRGLRRFERSVSTVRDRLSSMGDTALRIGAVGAVGLGFIAKAGLDTEKAMLRSRAELGLTLDQMRKLREEALRVGSQLPLNTADIINAQRAYGKLGATFEEIIRDTPAIAGAAVATALQPEQVAQYGRVIQNVFGGDLRENLDLMLRIANKSPATFQQLAESVQFAGQSAKDSGLSFKSYLAVLAGTAGAGRQVEAVAQGMTAMWARLAKAQEGIGRGGKIVKTAFESVGISMVDVERTFDGTERGFMQLLQLINKAGLSTRQLTALMSTLAGDTYSASLSFAVQNPEMIENLFKEGEIAGGEIDRQMEIILEGASGAIIRLRAMVDTLLNRLAEFGTLPGIKKFADGISNMIDWLVATDKEGKLVNAEMLDMISKVVIATASFLALGVALKAAAFALSGYLWIMRGVEFIAGLSAIRNMLVKVRSLGVAMAVFTLSNPVMLGIAALVAAGLLIYNNWEPLVEFFTNLTEKLKALVQKTREYFGITDEHLQARPGLSGLSSRQGLEALSNPTLPVAPAPAATGGLPGLAGLHERRNQTTVNINEINIETQATNAREIAGTVSQEIQEQSRRAIEQADTNIGG